MKTTNLTCVCVCVCVQLCVNDRDLIKYEVLEFYMC